MKYISKIALSLTILLICFSCSSSLHQSGLGGSVNVSANADLNADVTVGDEIQGYAKESYLFGFFQISSIGPRLVVAGVGNNEVCSAAADGCSIGMQKLTAGLQCPDDRFDVSGGHNGL